ncbi:MAG TPA: hypothetical protein VF634_06505 [Pyrinomonadaceae bacterium]
MKFSSSTSRFGAAVLVLACLTITVSGQVGEPPAPQPVRINSTPSIFDPTRPDRDKAPSEMSGPRRSRAGTFPSPPRRALTEEHKRRLYPSAEERDRFAAFLRQPRSGLARLLPQSDCGNDTRVLTVGNACAEAVPPVPGGGSFYSFGSSEHQLARLADVWLKDGTFRAGVAGDALGLLTVLGDVPLESVTPQTAQAAYLAQFAPPTTVADAQRHYARSNAGFHVEGRAYGSAAQVKPDTTYVLRSIMYGADGPLGKKRKATDVLVSFRVVSRAEDGSVTLLWRELLRSKPPKLKD